ncbi:MAG: hypothetical protein SPL50_07580 [Alloprevotella sp.]|nr:hypothetical protein [Alloprevotella sp.]MDY6298123.1 hypothetical protein [Alloprevotella sp.]
MTRTQAIIQQVGGLVMLVGAVLPLFVDDFSVAFYCFSAGAVAFAGIQFLQRYDGDDFRLRRLRRQQVAGALLLLVTAILMFTHWQHIAPFRGDEWKVTLAIAAVLEVYTAFRMP